MRKSLKNDFNIYLRDIEVFESLSLLKMTVFHFSRTFRVPLFEGPHESI